MTRIRIDGAAVAALGRTLSDHAAALEGIGEVPELGVGFIADGGPACTDAVTGWGQRRTDLCAELDALAALARDAGALFVETERSISRWGRHG